MNRSSHLLPKKSRIHLLVSSKLTRLTKNSKLSKIVLIVIVIIVLVRFNSWNKKYSLWNRIKKISLNSWCSSLRCLKCKYQLSNLILKIKKKNQIHRLNPNKTRSQITNHKTINILKINNNSNNNRLTNSKTKKTKRR